MMVSVCNSHNCFDSTNFKEGYAFLRNAGIFNSDRFRKIKRSGAIAECLTEEALSAQSRHSDLYFWNFEILLNQTAADNLP